MPFTTGTRSPSPAHLLGLGLLLASGAVDLQAQLPTPRLTSVFPPGGQAGATVTVSAGGTDLTAPTGLRFSHPGISAAVTGAQFRVAVGNNVPPGCYDVRWTGRFGVSNPRSFMVGDQPEINDPGTNQSPATALTVPLGTIVNGIANERAMDYVQFNGRRGQSVRIACLGRELDSRIEPVVFVESPSGRELARTRRGEALDVTPTEDGPHRIVVHDRLFRGGEAYFYRLSVGAGPWVDYVLPPVATPGQPSRLALWGRGLPYGTPTPGGLQSMPLELRLGANDPRIGPRGAATPAEIAVDTFEFPIDPGVGSAGGVVSVPIPASNPVRIGITSLPILVETEPNNAPESPARITVPAEVSGQFWPRADVDCFAFDAKKGEVFWLEIISHRLGLPTDPQVLVQRLVRTDKATNLTDVLELADADANPGGVDFNFATRDPVGRLEIKEDGTHVVQVRDLFGTATASPAHVYRLAIRREQPDFRLAALPVSGAVVPADKKQSLVAATVLRRGETVPVRLVAVRRDGFNGEITITASDLPAGVTAMPARMPAGQSAATLLFTASSNAAGFVGPIRFTGRAMAGDRELVRPAVGGTVVWPVADQAAEPTASRVTRETILAVADPEVAPVRLVPTGIDPAVAVPPTNKLQLTVEVLRQEGWGAAFKLKAAGLPAFDSIKEIDVPAGTNRVTMTFDLAAQKVPAGDHRFWLQGSIAGKWVDPIEGEASKQAEAALKEAEKAQAEAAAAAKSAAQALADARKVAGAAELKKLAELADRDAAARLKDWDARKTAATAAAKAAKDRAKVRDVTTMVYSPAITFRVAAPTAVAKK